MPDQHDIGFFGHPDARFDRNFFDKYEPIEAFEIIKRGDSGTKLIVTGVFGSGKSALKYQIENLESESAFIWSTDELNPPNQVLDFHQLRRHPGSIANVTINTLLWELANRIIENREQFDQDAVEKLKGLFPSLIQKIIGVASKAKVQDPYGLIQIDLEDVLGNHGGSLSRKMPISEWKEALIPCLSFKPAIILFDDVEMIFPGLDEIPEAVDGLLYACELLNESFEQYLTFLIFLQWSTYVHLQRHSRRFEKVVSRMEKIKWSRDQLIKLLTSRVSQRFSNQTHNSNETILEEVFELRSDEKNPIDAAIDLCVNGPRDLIYICNSAYQISEGGLITVDHINHVKHDFGDMKLFGIEREYDARYPNIRQFIEHYFCEKQIYYAPQELSNYLSSVLSEARDLFGKHDWLIAAGKRVIEVLYEIGFLGFKRTQQSPLLYVINQPYAHLQPDFHMSSKLFVHPAFHSRLGLTH